MAAEGTKAYEQAVKDGDRPLSSATALNCLRAVLAQIQDVPTHQFLACDVDWSHTRWSDAAMVRSFVAPGPSTTHVGNKKAGGVQEFLANYLERAWDDVAESRLPDLGLDSLDVVQLRAAFAKTFHAAPLSTFNTPQSLTQLAKALEVA